MAFIKLDNHFGRYSVCAGGIRHLSHSLRSSIPAFDGPDIRAFKRKVTDPARTDLTKIERPNCGKSAFL